MHFVTGVVLMGVSGGLAIRDARRAPHALHLHDEHQERLVPPAIAQEAFASSPGVVSVRTSDVDDLRAGFRATQKREPIPAELADLVEEFVAEEMLFREGLSRGLDRDDRVVRRRVIDRMTELARPHAPTREPTRAELESWFRAYPHRFVQPATLTVEQLFFDPRRHPDAGAAAGRALALIEGGASVAPSRPVDELADPTLLPRKLTDSTELELSHLFGHDFAAEAMAAPVGAWRGPVSSPHGAHLLRVLARQPQPPRARA